MVDPGGAKCLSGQVLYTRHPWVGDIPCLGKGSHDPPLPVCGQKFAQTQVFSPLRRLRYLSAEMPRHFCPMPNAQCLGAVAPRGVCPIQPAQGALRVLLVAACPNIPAAAPAGGAASGAPGPPTQRPVPLLLSLRAVPDLHLHRRDRPPVGCGSRPCAFLPFFDSANTRMDECPKPLMAFIH